MAVALDGRVADWGRKMTSSYLRQKTPLNNSNKCPNRVEGGNTAPPFETMSTIEGLWCLWCRLSARGGADARNRCFAAISS